MQPHGGPLSDDPIDLHRFARRVYSESGEDGILEKLFETLGAEPGFFVEFGAWDGLRLSNTRLLAERGWAGILIEGDPDKYRQLQNNVQSKRVTSVNAHVSPQGENTLDAILEKCSCPHVFDLLSIDVDSDDLAIWMSLKRHRPTCVVIEFNATIPFDVDFINPPGRAWGNSARTIERIARAKGYRLVAITKMNLVFVDSDVCVRADLAIVSLETKFMEVGERLFWGYDGTLIRWHPVNGASAPEFLRVPFQDYLFAQPMPRFLRRWRLGNEPRRTRRLVSILSAVLARPISYLRFCLSRRSAPMERGRTGSGPGSDSSPPRR
jgi:hypothetical protein